MRRITGGNPDGSAAAGRAGPALVAGSAIAFGTLAIFGKVAGRLHMPLAELLGLRFGLAALILWALCVLRGERLWWGRRAAGLCGMGILYVVQAAAYFSSLRTVPAAVTSILLYLYPVFVVVLARVVFGERVTGGRAAALLLAVGGAALVVDPLHAAAHLTVAGVVFGVASGATYSVYIMCGSRLVRGIPAIVAAAHIATTGGLCFLGVAAVTHSLAPLDGARLSLSIGMATIATVVPASLFLAGLARVGPARTAIISTLEPATTVALASVVLGELLSPIQLFGGAAVLGAAVVVARARPQLNPVDPSPPG